MSYFYLALAGIPGLRDRFAQETAHMLAPRGPGLHPHEDLTHYFSQE